MKPTSKSRVSASTTSSEAQYAPRLRDSPELHATSVREPQRAIIVARRGDESADEAARQTAELTALLDGLGVVVIEMLTQRRSTTSGPVLGSGKREELLALIAHHHPAEWQGPRAPLLVVVDGALTAGQQALFERSLDDERCGPLVVLDRVSLILRVFEARAATPLARMETELARLRYEGPRVREDAADDDRQGGGGRGERGHTNAELRRGRIRERIAALEAALANAHRVDDGRRARRADVHVVALVGYTNAGKSSLMRALTGADVLVEDKLFATLGTTVRPIVPALVPQVLVADTVGFLRALPHEVIGSFRSTLREADAAGLLLFVVDVGDPSWREHLSITRKTIAELEGDAPARDALVVLNKVDTIDDETQRALAEEFPDAVQMCAEDPVRVRALRDAIGAHFERDTVVRELHVPFAAGRLVAEVRAQARVLTETHDEHGFSFTLRGAPDVLEQLAARAREAAARGG